MGSFFGVEFYGLIDRHALKTQTYIYNSNEIGLYKDGGPDIKKKQPRTRKK